MRKSAIFGSPLIVAILLLAACAPSAQPGPTAAPAQPAPTTAPAKPESQPATAKPAATQAAAKPATAPAASPATGAAFDEQAVAGFYRGKTIRIIVGFSAGGGFDNYSRLIAKHLGKYIPGNPTVVVENMPGASSMLAMNHVANVATKDGTVIGNVIGTLVLNQLFGIEGVEFDMARLQYIGVPNAATYVGFIHQRAGVTRWEQVAGPDAREVVVGTDAPGSTVHDGPTMLRDLVDAKLKLVPGFGGTSQVRLAVDRGEVDGIFNSWDSMKITNLEDIQKGVYVPIVQLTVNKVNAPELANVPGINEITSDEEARQLLRFGLDIPNNFLRLYILPSEAPADRVAALQQAFARTMEDKEFLADAEKGKFDVSPVAGSQVKSMVSEMLSMPAEIKEKLKKTLLPS